MQLRSYLNRLIKCRVMRMCATGKFNFMHIYRTLKLLLRSEQTQIKNVGRITERGRITQLNTIKTSAIGTSIYF